MCPRCREIPGSVKCPWGDLGNSTKPIPTQTAPNRRNNTTATASRSAGYPKKLRYTGSRKNCPQSPKRLRLRVRSHRSLLFSSHTALAAQAASFTTATAPLPVPAQIRNTTLRHTNAHRNFSPSMAASISPTEIAHGQLAKPKRACTGVDRFSNPNSAPAITALLPYMAKNPTPSSTTAASHLRQYRRLGPYFVGWVRFSSPRPFSWVSRIKPAVTINTNSSQSVN